MTEAIYFTPLQTLLDDADNQVNCIEKLQTLLRTECDLKEIHIEQREGEMGLCIHYDPDLVTLDHLQALVKMAGAKINDLYQQVDIELIGLESIDTATMVERDLESVDGILAAKVSYAAAQLRLEFDTRLVSLDVIQTHLKRLGYLADGHSNVKAFFEHHGELWISLLSGITLLLAWLSSFVYQYLSYLLIAFSYFFAGALTGRNSIQTIKQRRFDIDLLMLLAAVGAGLIGAYYEGALLLFLFSLGHSLEHHALDRARHAVKALADLAPKFAMVMREGELTQIPVEDIQVGDHVIVKPGQRIPVDGEVLEGQSTVDQSPITGESMPVNKTRGEGIFTGSINGEAVLTIRATTLPTETVLSRMVKLVLEADTQKAASQRLAERFVKYFVPIVLLSVFVLIFVPPLWGEEWRVAFYRAMAVLVAASPCALAIATPAAILSGVARAAQQGVLFKGGRHLENLGLVQSIVFDKTGTLTMGQPRISQLIPFGVDEDVLLKAAYSIERLSAHPLSKAIVTLSEERGLGHEPVENMQSVAGRGLHGRVNGQIIAVGSAKMFKSLPDGVRQSAAAREQAGETVMIVSLGEQFVGVISVADPARPESSAVLQKLKGQGLEHLIMLTGDHHEVARAMAEKIGLTNFQADLLPEEKLKAIKDIVKEHPVAMVGDGVNDAPAMAQATVGIAMGGAGTDVALEAADVALMADDLSKLPFAIALSRQAATIIRQNLWIALVVIGILLFGTATDRLGIGPAVIFHEGSTLAVVLNGLRLLRFR